MRPQRAYVIACMPCILAIGIYFFIVTTIIVAVFNEGDGEMFLRMMSKVTDQPDMLNAVLGGGFLLQDS